MAVRLPGSLARIFHTPPCETCARRADNWAESAELSGQPRHRACVGFAAWSGSAVCIVIVHFLAFLTNNTARSLAGQVISALW